jgi:RHS repeat-associated protein
MVMTQSNPGTSPENKLLYNSKEIQDDVVAGKKLDWYDYGHRFFDPVLGRFFSIDPFADGFEMVSPYQYAFNNPIRWIDLDGLEGVNPGTSDPALGFLEAKRQMNGGRLSERDLAFAMEISSKQSKGTIMGFKYTGIILSFTTTAGIILGPSTLGLNIVNDALPNNEKAQNSINNPGGIPGLITEGISGEDQTLLKKIGELILGISTSSNPVDILNVTVDAAEAGNELLKTKSNSTRKEVSETNNGDSEKKQTSENYVEIRKEPQSSGNIWVRSAP